MSIVNTKGVDISYWNGDIDLAKVKNAGYKWVMIRCGWGNDSTSKDDSRFAANVAKAEKLGMPWGVYLFSYACSTSDAKSELEHIDRLLKEQKAKGYLPTLPIAIDIEPTDEVQNRGGWTSSNLTNVATIVLDGLKSRGYYPIIYTGYEELAMMNDHIRNDFDCWFAQWSSRPSAYKYNRLGMWQYGGETNYIDSPTISGVGVIDQDIAYKDYPTIIKNGGYNGWSQSSGGNTPSEDNTPKDDTPVTPTPTPAPNVNPLSIYIQGVAGGKWLKVVKDGSTYSGTLGKALVALAAKVTEGTITYSAHLTGGKWLGNITGWNYKDYINGYAGSGNPAQNGASIDAIRMYYKTPQNIVSKYGYYKVAYRVHLINGSWLDWQYDTETTNGQDGYAGIFGTIIDGVQVKLVKA